MPLAHSQFFDCYFCYGLGGEGVPPLAGAKSAGEAFHQPVYLVAAKRKRIRRLHLLKRHKPAPDHETATAFFLPIPPRAGLPA